MLGALKVVFCLLCVFAEEMAHVKSTEEPLLRVQTAPVSGYVTLPCFIQERAAAVFYWYKQTLGQKPKKVSTLSVYTQKITLHNDFGNNPRIKVDRNNTLTISDLQMTDSATYYCGFSNVKEFNFANGVIVQVTDAGPSFQAWVHQPKIVEPGSSLTLNCRIHTSICDGEHSVYWFREAEGSRSGVINAHGGGSGRCARNASTQTHTCVYNLPLDALDEPHNGTYYCALATCGHILFGNGTKLDFSPETDSRLYFWSGVSAFTAPLSLLLALLVCVMNRGNSCPCAGCAVASTAKGGDDVLYAASREKPRSHRDDTWSECVYLMVDQ